MMNGVMFNINLDDYLLRALKEDITSEDVTTNAVMPTRKNGSVDLIAKEDGIICGLEVFKRVFTLLDNTTTFETSYQDGDLIEKGIKIGTLFGDIRVLLSGERVALNYLQRMSGIATYTNQYVTELKGYSTTLLDTRKTTPNMRPFEKYAVTIGGGKNHRYNLSDGVLLKDNHIDAAGSVKAAIQYAKKYAPFVRKIEIEVETLEMVNEAVLAGADIIMLDNMDMDAMKQAITMIDGKAETEVSGNITKERLKEIASLGVDYVSSGAITYNAPILDLSMKHLTVIN